jgi:protein tyrosine/serine phosphatase
MSRTLGNLAGVVIIGALIVAPVVLALRWGKDTRNFRAVREGVLYRSGQMSVAGLSRIVHDYGIRTVVNLRDGKTPADQAEEAFCNREEIRFVRLEPAGWGDGAGSAAPAEENVRAFCKVMADPANYPVLIHCFAGTHRTGAYCAVYRMEFEHWDNARALAEIRACGYANIDDEWDILGFLEQYTPAWRKPRPSHASAK